IMLPRTVLRIRASLSLENTHILDRIYYFKVTDSNLFNEKFVLGILNSKLISFYYNHLYGSTKIGGGYFDLKGVQIKKLPIPRTNKEQSDSIERLVEAMIEKTSILEMNSSRFKKLLINEFSLDSLSAKLNKWWVLDFTDFVSVLKVKLSLSQKDELLQLFDKYRAECIQIDSQIKQTDQDIDQLVYKLYDLSAEDINLIETR
ncbi:MAG: TaqI-like C-terminal specificity domain-containing protein, partial [Candidatus Saccharibacteria bacterium]